MRAARLLTNTEQEPGSESEHQAGARQRDISLAERKV